MTVLCLDSTTIPLSLIAECDHMMTDPPYSRHVHGNAVSASGKRGTKKREFGFNHLSPATRRWIGRCAASVRKWSLLYSDVEMSTYLRISCEAAGATYIRTVPWVRWSMPLLNGDRPAQGFEHLVITWGADTGTKAWSGPGSLVALEHEAPSTPEVPLLDHTCMRGDTKHKAEKPLDQCLDLVSWFSKTGERIFDPFAGHGTMGLAALLLGREYVGIEVDPVWADKSNARFQRLSESDAVRIKKWVASTDDKSKPATDLSRARAARRAADKESLKWV